MVCIFSNDIKKGASFTTGHLSRRLPVPAPCGVRPECSSWKYRTHPSFLFPSPLQPQFNELGVLRAPLQNTCQSTSASLHLTLPPSSKPPVFFLLNSCSRLVPIYLPPDAPSVSSTAACGLPSVKICHFAPRGEQTSCCAQDRT